jgi:hypothetical protein
MAITPTEARGDDIEAKIKRIEEFLDGELRQQFRGGGSSLSISLDHALFDPSTQKGKTIRERITKLYQDAGWVVTLTESGDLLTYAIHLRPA